MKAMVLEHQNDIKESPLLLVDLATPFPGEREIRIRVHCTCVLPHKKTSLSPHNCSNLICIENKLFKQDTAFRSPHSLALILRN